MKRTGSEVIAETLSSMGISHFFYVTGGMPSSFYDSIEAAGVRMVLCRNEKGACTAAEGYSRLTNRPSVCYGQHGAAAAILGSMLYEASYNHSPVVALTGSLPLSVKDRWLYQDCDEMPYFLATCKYNVDVTDPLRVEDALSNAVQVAVSGCPGPTHVSIHSDTPGRTLDVAEPRVRRKGPFVVPPSRPLADPSSVFAAAELLCGAERPIVVCGSGVHLSGAYAELAQLTELLSLPVAVTLKGRGAFPEEDPHFIGVTGSYGMKVTNDIVREADVVFLLATRADPHATDGMTAPEPGKSKIVQLDIEPTVVGRNYQADVALIGDARATLRELIAAVSDRARKGGASDRLARVSKALGEYRNSLETQIGSNDVPVRPQRLVGALANLLRRTDIVVSDTGHMLSWTSQMLSLKGVGRVYLPCGGTLGSSFGEAIGASFGAAETQRVINLIGDGGLAYNLGELETVRRYSDEVGPFVILVNNNSSFAQSRTNYKEQVERTRGWISTTDFKEVDFRKVAEGFGLEGFRVERPSELERTIRKALDLGAPALVDVVTEKNAYPVTRPYFPR